MKGVAAVAFAFVAIVVVPYVFGLNDYVMSLLLTSLTIGGVALAWALLSNLGGMVSLGHAAFFGVGSYASAVIAKSIGMPVFLSMTCGGLAAMAASLAMLPILRLRGAYFALAVLAYAQVFRILATELSSLTGGAAGLLSIPRLPVGLPGYGAKVGEYVFIATFVILLAFFYDRIRNSYSGLALRAMHESEVATRVVGVPAFRLKAAMLFVSAFATGVIGAFNAHVIGFLQPDYAFSMEWSILPMVAAIFGGYRTVIGPILGAVSIYMLDQLLFKNLLPQGHQIVLGALLCAMILLSPRGLLPLVAQQWGAFIGRLVAKDARNA